MMLRLALKAKTYGEPVDLRNEYLAKIVHLVYAKEKSRVAKES